jgi:ABC-type multidrug transport system permease subunit
MQGLRAVVRKEFLHIRRDPRLIGYVLALPIIILFLFGFALRITVDDLRVAVHDQSRSFFSLSLKDRLRSEGNMRVEEVDSDEAITAMLQDGRAHLGLIIPADFSERVTDGKQTTFTLLVDGTMPTVALAALYGAKVLTTPEATKSLILDDPDSTAAPPRPAPVKIAEKVLFNPKMRDSDFFLPGTIGIVLMLVSLTVTTTGLVREKEQQTIEQLWATPLTRLALIGGKILPCGIIAAFDAALCIALSLLVFGLPIHGSVAAVIALNGAFILALLALGTFISAISETQLQASFLNIFIFIISLCMSGFIFPIESMPRALQPVAWALPMTYFLEGMRDLMLKGSGFAGVMRDFIGLGALTLVLGGLSLANMQKQRA